MSNSLREEFAERYQSKPRLFRAPGRVNLIGEHTDYNDGFVLPVAIDRFTWVAAAPRSDHQLHVTSLAYDESAVFDMENPCPEPSGHWSDYVRGVATVLKQAGYPIAGANLMIKSTIPIGAGLSSSAALGVAVGKALAAMGGVDIAALDLALFCQQSENEFIGIRSGIMDQMIACLAQPGHALLIDCRSLESTPVPIDESKASIVVCNTKVKHALAGSEYNTRRLECEEGVKRLSLHIPEIRSLRDVSLSQFQPLSRDLPENIRIRCHHVITENQRVLAAIGCLQSGDLEAFGTYMGQSHQSLKDDYQVSCPELDVMVAIAAPMEGVYGARMTGGGFGGCTVNLIAPDAEENCRRQIKRSYHQKTGIDPDIYSCRSTGSAEEIKGDE
ncbi:MAG: galactokinase [Desulfobacterales bacterium]